MITHFRIRNRALSCRPYVYGMPSKHLILRAKLDDIKTTILTTALFRIAMNEAHDECYRNGNHVDV